MHVTACNSCEEEGTRPHTRVNKTHPQLRLDDDEDDDDRSRDTGHVSRQANLGLVLQMGQLGEFRLERHGPAD